MKIAIAITGIVIGFLLILILTGCGGSSTSTPPQSEWMIIEPLPEKALPPGDYLDFPTCANAQVCWVSYVAKQWLSPINGKTITMQYTITGNFPIFNNATADNNGLDPAISLLINSQGGGIRWFSRDRQLLTVGTHTFSVQLMISLWTAPIPPGQPTAWDVAMSVPGQLGFCFGGGDFSCHGVSVSSGSARLTINSYNVQ